MFAAKKIVDLSFPLTSETPIFPGNPVPKINEVMSVDKDGINLQELYLGSQSGSHVDAPYHFRDNGDHVDESPLNLFVGTAVVIPVLNKDEKEKITMKDVQPYLESLEPGKIPLFYTSWSKYAGEEKFYRHPYVDIEVINELLKMEIKTFAIDCINLDCTGGTSYPVHEAVADASGIIIENLTNLDKIDFDNPLLCAFPLAIPGSDGSPVRAVAIKL